MTWNRERRLVVQSQRFFSSSDEKRPKVIIILFSGLQLTVLLVHYRDFRGLPKSFWFEEHAYWENASNGCDSQARPESCIIGTNFRDTSKTCAHSKLRTRATDVCNCLVVRRIIPRFFRVISTKNLTILFDNFLGVRAKRNKRPKTHRKQLLVLQLNTFCLASCIAIQNKPKNKRLRISIATQINQ